MADVLSGNDPTSANNLDDFIAYGKNMATITHYNYSILQTISSDDKTLDMQFSVSNLVDDYLDDLRDIAVTVPLSLQEQRKYYYKPDLLAYDIYGSIELEFIILKLNGIINPDEFDFPNVKLINQSRLISLLSDIYNTEIKFLNANREKYNLSMPS